MSEEREKQVGATYHWDHLATAPVPAIDEPVGAEPTAVDIVVEHA